MTANVSIFEWIFVVLRIILSWGFRPSHVREDPLSSLSAWDLPGLLVFSLEAQVTRDALRRRRLGQRCSG